MKKIKKLFKKYRVLIGAVIGALAIVAGATVNQTDDMVVDKLEKGLEVADKLLLEEEADVDAVAETN